jgi:hypothetical protein
LADLKEKSGMSLLSSTTMSLATSASKQVLYTVPTGKSCIVTHVVIRSPSATAAAATSVACGFTVTSGTAGDFRQSQTLVNLSTATTGALIWDFPSHATTQTQSAIGIAGSTFGIWLATGASVTATIDVFGYLF